MSDDDDFMQESGDEESVSNFTYSMTWDTGVANWQNSCSGTTLNMKTQTMTSQGMSTLRINITMPNRSNRIIQKKRLMNFWAYRLWKRKREIGEINLFLSQHFSLVVSFSSQLLLIYLFIFIHRTSAYSFNPDEQRFELIHVSLASRGFKGLKQAIKLEFKLGRYDDVRLDHSG